MPQRSLSAAENSLKLHVPTLCSELVGCISCVELLCLIVVQDFEKLRKFFSYLQILLLWSYVHEL